MSIDEKTVRKIAHLARIKLQDDELQPMAKELNGILDWLAQLKEVDTSKVEPMSSVVQQALPQRDDVINDGDIVEAILQNAPASTAGFFAVPKVVE